METQAVLIISEDAEFSRAIEDFLKREGAGVASYVDELAEHSPFKAGR